MNYPNQPPPPTPAARWDNDGAHPPPAPRHGEHYGLAVAAEAGRQQTLGQGAQISALTVTPPPRAAATLVTQLDGSMLPIVVPPPTGEDRRRGKQLLWREARLCLARPA